MNLNHLEALHIQAPPAPWFAGSYTGVDLPGEDYSMVPFAEHPKPDTISIIAKDPALPINGNEPSYCSLISTGSGEYTCNHLAIRLAVEARNALPALLAVAKAAKCYTNADPMVRGEAYRDLCEALSRLEAQ